MKKNLQILLLLLITSCQNKTTEIRYYPSEEPYNKSTIFNLNLNNSELNFNEIAKKVGNNQDNNIRTVIELNDNGIIKRIMPFRLGNGLIKERNRLTITSDSIQIDSGCSIKKLKKILKRHYTNKGKESRYSFSPRFAIVEIKLDTSETSTELKKSLINLTRTFDEIENEVQDTLKLVIYFHYTWSFPSPQPPKPVEFEK